MSLLQLLALLATGQLALARSIRHGSATPQSPCDEVSALSKMTLFNKPIVWLAETPNHIWYCPGGAFGKAPYEPDACIEASRTFSGEDLPTSRCIHTLAPKVAGSIGTDNTLFQYGFPQLATRNNPDDLVTFAKSGSLRSVQYLSGVAWYHAMMDRVYKEAWKTHPASGASDAERDSWAQRIARADKHQDEPWFTGFEYSGHCVRNQGQVSGMIFHKMTGAGSENFKEAEMAVFIRGSQSVEDWLHSDAGQWTLDWSDIRDPLELATSSFDQNSLVRRTGWTLAEGSTNLDGLRTARKTFDNIRVGAGFLTAAWESFEGVWNSIEANFMQSETKYTFTLAAGMLNCLNNSIQFKSIQSQFLNNSIQFNSPDPPSYT